MGWRLLSYLPTCLTYLYLAAVLLHSKSSEQQAAAARSSTTTGTAGRQILLLSAQPAARPVLLSPDRPPMMS